jgi:UPF0755 protein
MKKKRNKFVIPGISVIFILLLLLFYQIVFNASVSPIGNRAVIFIPTGSVYSQVRDSLKAHLIVKNWMVFDRIAIIKKYPGLIKPGKYVIEKQITCQELISLLRAGKQVPVKVTFSNINTIAEIAGKIGCHIEADSLRIMEFLNNADNFRNDGFRKETIISVFIPNTYELNWNTSPTALYNRMLKEYQKFWNNERSAKAKEKKLTQTEVATLASIIDDEASKPDEKPRIAGVYLNRLRKGIPLQADPTIKFALNDFSITRILFKHLEVDSPYNTYKHAGLPPGPIGCPTIEGIDAVLNAEKSDYLFFVAKADFSGYHNFSKTLAEHNRYASLYQRELTKRKIFK